VAPDDMGGKHGSRQHRSVREVQGFIQELTCGGRKSQGGGRRAKAVVGLSIFYVSAFSALTLLVGWKETEWWDAGMVICLG